MTKPRYLQIADEIRAHIASGELQPGDRIPSQPEMIEAYGVSDGVAKAVVRVLRSEGLAVSKPGSGVFVRRRPPVRRLTRSWYQEFRGGAPFAADMAEQGREGSWTYRSETVQAQPEIRDRLELEQPDGDAPDVMRTEYVFRADGEPVMLSVSYEPYELTRGTAIVFPEEGPSAGLGVVERMALVGVDITDAAEIVTARKAAAGEASDLGLPPGALVLVVRRTYLAEARPVETADIVIPVDLYELMYPIPVRGRIASST